MQFVSHLLSSTSVSIGIPSGLLRSLSLYLFLYIYLTNFALRRFWQIPWDEKKKVNSYYFSVLLLVLLMLNSLAHLSSRLCVHGEAQFATNMNSFTYRHVLFTQLRPRTFCLHRDSLPGCHGVEWLRQRTINTAPSIWPDSNSIR